MDIHEEQECAPLTLFYSHANEDEQLYEELKKHLKTWQEQENIPVKYTTN